jgi:hypothetical protein
VQNIEGCPEMPGLNELKKVFIHLLLLA